MTVTKIRNFNRLDRKKYRTAGRAISPFYPYCTQNPERRARYRAGGFQLLRNTFIRPDLR